MRACTLVAAFAVAKGYSDVLSSAKPAGCGCASSRSSVSVPDGQCTSEQPAGPRRAEAASTATPHRDVVRIPAGRAQLGVAKPHFPADAEGPVYTYQQRLPFWMDRYEVSNGQFLSFVTSTGFVTEAESYGWSFVHELAIPEAIKATITQSVQGAEWWLPVNNASWRTPEGAGTDVAATGRLSHPAVHVSYRDALAYCRWAGGGRLPSEEEWEYAARGGAKAPAGLTYPWGEELLGDDEGGAQHKVAADGSASASSGGSNFSVVVDRETGRVHRANVWQGEFPYKPQADDGHLWTAPVTAYGPQNRLGLYNVIGNVWEWTSTTWCPHSALQLQAHPQAGQGDLGNITSPHKARSVPPECRLRPGANPPPVTDAGEVDMVKRGGSFLCHKSFCFRYRSAARHKNTINSSASNLGFRCVWDKKPQQLMEQAQA